MKALGRTALKPLINPALIEHQRERQQSIDNRIADRITVFSGSMRFVWLHAIWFAAGIGDCVEGVPVRAKLTMIVRSRRSSSRHSRDDQPEPPTRRVALANQEWRTVQEEDTQQNEELLNLSKQILELTKADACADRGGKGN
jgi:hypothetical protein